MTSTELKLIADFTLMHPSVTRLVFIVLKGAIKSTGASTLKIIGTLKISSTVIS
jgi:hypothetical protein